MTGSGPVGLKPHFLEASEKDDPSLLGDTPEASLLLWYHQAGSQAEKDCTHLSFTLRVKHKHGGWACLNHIGHCPFLPMDPFCWFSLWFMKSFKHRERQRIRTKISKCPQLIVIDFAHSHILPYVPVLWVTSNFKDTLEAPLVGFPDSSAPSFSKSNHYPAAGRYPLLPLWIFLYVLNWTIWIGHYQPFLPILPT